MTRTILSIRFVLILATVIGIRGEETPREATLTIMSNFEDGQSDREFKVDYAGFSGSASPVIINIFKEGETLPKVEHTVENAGEAQILYFKLKEADAPEGRYQVQVCAGGCSERRSAVGEVLKEEAKPTLTCIKGTGQEENVFHRFVDDIHTREFSVKIIPGSSFRTPLEFDKLPYPIKETSAYTTLGLNSNPAYINRESKDIFYAAVAYNGTHLKDFFDTAVNEEQKNTLQSTYNVTRKLLNEEHTHAYCSRKYIFWASAHIVAQDTKLVVRRYRVTIMPSDASVNYFILNPEANLIPLELVQYDDTKLQTGTYDVSVSFCASDKDVINSSVCSEAIHSVLKVE